MSRTVVISITIPDGVDIAVAPGPQPVLVGTNGPEVISTARTLNEPTYLADSFAAPTQAPEKPAFPPFPPLHCKDHPSAPTRTVPAGTSKSSGKPYKAFLACSEPGCNWKANAA